MTQENRIVQRPEVRNLTGFYNSSSMERKDRFPAHEHARGITAKGGN